jgi:hypothetical protein
VSGSFAGASVDLAAVNGGDGRDGGVAHGARLLAFVEAVMGPDDAALERERKALRAVLSDAAFVDTCAVVGAFNVVDRIADATGIPLDAGMAAISGGVRAELGLSRFASSANTPPSAQP